MTPRGITESTVYRRCNEAAIRRRDERARLGWVGEASLPQVVPPRAKHSWLVKLLPRHATSAERNEELGQRYLSGGITYDRLAQEFGLTRERIRQIVLREKQGRTQGRDRLAAKRNRCTDPNLLRERDWPRTF